MLTIDYSGRLGNNLFQYAAAYIFAKKFNLQILTKPPKTNFNIPEFTASDSECYKNTIEVNDKNYMSLISLNKIEEANYKFTGYYQLKDFVLGYKDEIRSLFDLKYSKTNPKEVFVSYRIGDLIGLRQMIPIEYYQESLMRLNCNGGYITSDTPTHTNVKKLSEEFNLKIYEKSPEETIEFAKDFDNLVLSEGSYSWWIGFLSKARNVFYNERERFWHGNIFVLPEWKKLSYDWSPECVGQNNFLMCYNILKHE